MGTLYYKQLEIYKEFQKAIKEATPVYRNTIDSTPLKCLQGKKMKLIYIIPEKMKSNNESDVKDDNYNEYSLNDLAIHIEEVYTDEISKGIALSLRMIEYLNRRKDFDIDVVKWAIEKDVNEYLLEFFYVNISNPDNKDHMNSKCFYIDTKKEENETRLIGGERISSNSMKIGSYINSDGKKVGGRKFSDRKKFPRDLAYCKECNESCNNRSEYDLKDLIITILGNASEYTSSLARQQRVCP